MMEPGLQSLVGISVSVATYNAMHTGRSPGRCHVRPTPELSCEAPKLTTLRQLQLLVRRLRASQSDMAGYATPSGCCPRARGLLRANAVAPCSRRRAAAPTSSSCAAMPSCLGPTPGFVRTMPPKTSTTLPAVAKPARAMPRRPVAAFLTRSMTATPVMAIGITRRAPAIPCTIAGRTKRRKSSGSPDPVTMRVATRYRGASATMSVAQATAAVMPNAPATMCLHRMFTSPPASLAS